MLINDDIRKILDTFKSEKVNFMRQNGKFVFFEDCDGMSRILVMEDKDDTQDFQTSLDPSIMNFIKLSDKVDFKVTHSDFTLTSNDCVFNTKLGLCDDFTFLRGETSKIYFKPIIDVLPKFKGVSKGIIVSKSGIYNNNDIYKCFMNLDINTDTTVGLNIINLLELDKLIKSKVFYENDEFIFKQEACNGYVIQVGVRKLEIKSSDFIEFVNSCRPIDKIKIPILKLKKVFATVTNSDYVVLENNKLMTSDSISSFILTLDYNKEKLALPFKELKFITQKSNSDIELRIYDTFLVVNSREINFVIRR